MYDAGNGTRMTQIIRCTSIVVRLSLVNLALEISEKQFTNEAS